MDDILDLYLFYTSDVKIIKHNIQLIINNSCITSKKRKKHSKKIPYKVINNSIINSLFTYFKSDVLKNQSIQVIDFIYTHKDISAHVSKNIYYINWIDCVISHKLKQKYNIIYNNRPYKIKNHIFEFLKNDIDYLNSGPQKQNYLMDLPVTKNKKNTQKILAEGFNVCNINNFKMLLYKHKINHQFEKYFEPIKIFDDDIEDIYYILTEVQENKFKELKEISKEFLILRYIPSNILFYIKSKNKNDLMYKILFEYIEPYIKPLNISNKLIWLYEI
jgi:hypothetical protein